MVVGENSRENDLDVNVTKEKKLTNIRAAGSDDALQLIPPKILELEQAIEFIKEDELVEVAPFSLRVRKKILEASKRPKYRIGREER
jgi:GTP-binding protein